MMTRLLGVGLLVPNLFIFHLNLFHSYLQSNSNRNISEKEKKKKNEETLVCFVSSICICTIIDLKLDYLDHF